MNKDIDLTEILKNCPRGAKFYSYIFGEDTHFMGVSSHQGDAKPIFIYGKYGEGQNFCLTRKGHAYADNYGECCIFPSKDQRDWSKFTAPWVKKESDDEKIKNAILNHLKKMWGNCQDDVCGVHVEDAIDWLEKQGEPNPYSGVSFKYNSHIWGMCGRDGGVEILVDGKIKEIIFL